jgi:hypothetical protein
MLVIQRVRIVWTARGRGAAEATVRGRLPNAFPIYSMAWTYYDWTVNITHEPPRDDLFLDRKYDFERDDRVSFYGKPAHR